MSFPIKPATPPAAPDPASKQFLDDAAHKLSFDPGYKLLLEHLRLKAYKLLNDDLASVDARNDHNRGRLHAYAEIYRTLTSGKELFNAGP